MKTIKINLNNLTNDIFYQINIVLKNGGIIIHPTDTCYGIAADINNEKAVKKVFDFKKRERDKHLSIIASDKKMFMEYGFWSDLIDEILNEDKMYSFVVKKTEKIPEHFNQGINDIAIQLPRNEFSLLMLKTFGSPLTATSANISNFPSVYSVEDLLNQMNDKKIVPDLIIDAGKLPEIKPSTIIRIKNGGYEIIRP